MNNSVPKQNARLESLRVFLDDVGAMPINSVEGPNKSKLHFYAAAGTTLIVQVYAGDNGWEIYIPPSRSNEAVKTFAAARKALEVL